MRLVVFGAASLLEGLAWAPWVLVGAPFAGDWRGCDGNPRIHLPDLRGLGGAEERMGLSCQARHGGVGSRPPWPVRGRRAPRVGAAGAAPDPVSARRCRPERGGRPEIYGRPGTLRFTHL